MDTVSTLNRARSGGISANRGWRSRLAAASALTLLAIIAGVPAIASATSLPPGCAESSGVVTCTYTSGDNLFTVPAGVTSVHVVAIGGHGGQNGYGVEGNTQSVPGRGAVVTADLAVTPGSSLHAVVGGNGHMYVPGNTNGGGANGGGGGSSNFSTCAAGGGGGASDIRLDATLASRVLVAGGGGGVGCDGRVTYVPVAAGGDAGADGTPRPPTTATHAWGGQAGCPVGVSTGCGAGGQAGTDYIGNEIGADGGDGTLGLGGDAVFGYSASGGGGGAGYSGGGAGGSDGCLLNTQSGCQIVEGAGGGGGSNLVPANGTVQLATDDPEVVISYTAPITFNVVSAASPSGTSVSVTFDAQPDAAHATTLANYSVPGLTLSGTPILVGTTVTIASSAQAAQSYTVAVSNVTRASDSMALTTNTANFTGTATPATPQAQLSASSLSFGSVAVGAASAAQSVTVSNVGTGPLSVAAVSIGGTNASDFARDADGCSGASVAAGSSCTVSISFRPSARGARSAILRVSDDAADTPQSVALTGTGVTAMGQVAPAAIDFGTLAVGSTSGHRTVTITNIGDPGQTLTPSSAQITGANAADFGMVADTCVATGTQLAAGSSCTIDLIFTPGAPGPRSASLSIGDNGLGSPHTVSLTGTGGTPSADLAVSISASPNPVKTGQKVTYTITLLNAGPSTASTILINDSLSSQSTFVSATITGGICVTPKPGASGVVSCSLASLASGASKPVQIVVTVIAKKTSITNTVTVSAATADPNLANNTASITTRLK